MIPLAKGNIPPVLAAHAAAWTAVLVARHAAGEAPTKAEKSRYNHPEIKAALSAETNGKCAYCESKIFHIGFGHIEHVVPKSTDVNVWFSWNNLTLACEICNINKGTSQGLIDPYVDNPADHLWIVGSLILPVAGSLLGEITEPVLDLNRAELVERRAERLKNLNKLLGNIAKMHHADAKAALEADFLKEIESDKEYAALARMVHRYAQERGLLP